MQWLLKNSSSGQKIYELRNSKGRLLNLIYHAASGTLRISSDDEKRVFLIGEEGFLRRRTVLRNEYGVRMGQLSYDSNQDSHGNIDVYGEQFNYVLQNEVTPKAAIYKDAEMLVVCELPSGLRTDSRSDGYDLLILTLCWYISTAVKRRVEEYA